mgnify:CR=1 FL=1
MLSDLGSLVDKATKYDGNNPLLNDPICAMENRNSLLCNKITPHYKNKMLNNVRDSLV